MPVTGIGGLFFRARDPEGLSAWYESHLGIAGDPHWQQAAGPTVFMPFSRDTDYFAADKQWMINLRVCDLEAMMAALRAAGIAVETRPDWDTPETGRFARLHDPEGNAVELWEPPG
jgi:glyoxylase I family protein